MDYIKLIEFYIGRKINSNECELMDNNDGNGIFISRWDIPEKPQPTMQQLEELLPELNRNQLLQSTITPREFVLALMELGVTRNQIDALLSNNDRAWAELTFATCIVRGNELIDPLCKSLGITSEQLDNIFLSKGN